MVTQRLRALALSSAWLVVAASAAPAQNGRGYVPDRHPGWEHRTPAQVGMDAGRLETAIDFAKSQEATTPRDLEEAHWASFGREPHGSPIGPFKTRGEMTGVILRHGYIVAEWGEPDRVDMTFSVTKSFLSSTIGLAYDRGLIPDLDEPVRRFVTTGEFDDGLNAKITWDHLLRQTSDWEGTLWDKPDWADRPPSNQPIAEYMKRVHDEPGSKYKYNDVRVNLLAYAGLMVWRRPLPQVLREYVMDPIGASNTWRWQGYDNSWVNVDGQMMQSVSGGGHWGGGMFISAHDQARFGLLTLRRGKWGEEQILSEKWVTMALTPTPANGGYGFMNWFLNTGQRMLPSAPENAFCHLGNGTNMVCAFPDQDLVVVARWIKNGAMDQFVGQVLGSIASRSAGKP